MNNQSSLTKLKEFKKYVKSFVNFNKESNKEIHTLRVKSRELCSLISADDPSYKRVKKVIKLSNKIRDIDVFFELFLPSLPKKHRNRLEMESIKKSTNKSRKKKIEKLHKYLKSLIIPRSVLLASENHEINLLSGEEPRLDKAELHKYRIYIKKVLAKEKNSFPTNETKIKILSKIKDILGAINDNYNGLERLRVCCLNALWLSEIENLIQEKNLKLFNLFKKLNQKYTRSLS